MSRSNYDDCCDGWELIRWRGAVASAIKGGRGQTLLRDMITALDAMPEKRLIAASLEHRGEVCALGCVGRMKGIDMANLDPEDPAGVAHAFHIAPALAQEVVHVNDEWGPRNETPEARWVRMRGWVVKHLGPANTNTP